MFAFGQIRRKSAEKAVERGMRVVTVPYLCSSQTCSTCGKKQTNTGLWTKNKNEFHKFRCEHCKETVHSDANAARVLAAGFLGRNCVAGG